MRLLDLLEELQYYYEELGNVEVVMRGTNTNYADNISGIDSDSGIKTGWANDYYALVLTANKQEGAVWDLDELGIEKPGADLDYYEDE